MQVSIITIFILLNTQTWENKNETDARLSSI